MARHTPAPWSLHTEDLRGGTYHCVVRPGADETIDIHTGDNGGADAALIVSAPDMLAALKAMVGEIRKRHQTFDARIFVDAERAIAKAEGEGDAP